MLHCGYCVRDIGQNVYICLCFPADRWRRLTSFLINYQILLIDTLAACVGKHWVMIRLIDSSKNCFHFYLLQHLVSTINFIIKTEASSTSGRCQVRKINWFLSVRVLPVLYKLVKSLTLLHLLWVGGLLQPILVDNTLQNYLQNKHLLKNVAFSNIFETCINHWELLEHSIFD